MKNFYTELYERLNLGPAAVSIDENGNQSFGTEGRYCLKFTYPAHLVFFGAGHIARALARLAGLLSLSLTVVDDRPEMLTEEYFPPQARLICSDFRALDSIRELDDISNPYYCIFTHGHKADTDCLIYACRRNSGYIGMIGSKNKITRCFEEAQREGISRERLECVCSPIGLSINAVTPEEIAVSIMAQIISVYRQDKSAIIVRPDFIRKLSETEAVVCTVIEASGSSPARPGAMLIAGKENIGTVGGGALESAVIKDARTVRQNCIRHYDLDEKAELGMSCGGKVTVLFTPPA